jgi:hypothetical protein
LHHTEALENLIVTQSMKKLLAVGKRKAHCIVHSSTLLEYIMSQLKQTVAGVNRIEFSAWLNQLHKCHISFDLVFFI